MEASTRKEIKVGTFIFEISPSETGHYAKQQPLEYSAAVLASSFKRFVFVQSNKLRTNTYSRLKTSYREKRLKKQQKISHLRTAILSGSIRKIK